MNDAEVKQKLNNLLYLCKKNLPKSDEHLIKKAFQFSFDTHKNHFRKSGDLFFNHPYEVALIVVQEIPLDDICVAGALMHDVIEETNHEIDYDKIKAEFGSVIANIVDGLTKITDVSEKHEIKQAETYKKLLLAMASDIRVMLVKFADRLHNMRTLTFLSDDKRHRIAKETMEIYAPLAHRLGLGRIKWELEDAGFKHLHPKDYDELSRLVKSRRKEREQYISRLIKPLEEKLKEHGYTFEITGRPKHLYSIYQKKVRRGKEFDEIDDLLAIRIILETDDPKTCYNAYALITEKESEISSEKDLVIDPKKGLTIIPGTLKDYINVKKQNEYQSLHFVVMGPQGKKVEMQIRTRPMHEIAENGVAAHWRYKGIENSKDPEVEKWIRWVREIIDQMDSDTSPTQLVETVQQQLFQNEIYVFTPKGEVKILPRGATPVDFAFEVHTNVGMHCISAKINGKIVPLDAPLKSGDQIEIITSKNQQPSLDWEKFVVTGKARQKIRRLRRESEHKEFNEGKEIFEHRARKLKIRYTEEELQRALHDFHFDSIQKLFVAIQEGKAEPDGILVAIDNRQKNIKIIEPPAVQEKKESKTGGGLFDNFVQTARKLVDGVTFFGGQSQVMYSFARCCHPIPGDEVIGFVTVGEGVKIHRSTCKNITSMQKAKSSRLVEVGWPKDNKAMFAAAVKLSGDDRAGLVNDLTKAISTFKNTNIRSINVETHDSLFDGLIVLDVIDTEHLLKIIDKMKKVKSVKNAIRFEEL
jgi:RelA/SpoT family (p)ppGpp synthetase